MEFQGVLSLESQEQGLVGDHQPTSTLSLQETLPQTPWTLQNHSSPISARVPPQITVHMENPRRFPCRPSLPVQTNGHTWPKLLRPSADFDRIRRGIRSRSHNISQGLPWPEKEPNRMERVPCLQKHMGTRKQSPPCTANPRKL